MSANNSDNNIITANNKRARKVLGHQAEEFVLNLLEYFNMEKRNWGPLIPVTAVQERVANALKISISTVNNVLRRTKKRTNNAASSTTTSTTTTSTIKNKRVQAKPKTRDLVESTKMEIRNVLYNMYKEKKKVNIKNLNLELKQKKVINFSNTSLSVLLKDIGFKYKIAQNSTTLTENPLIVAKRELFLRKYLKNKKLMIPYSKEVVFLDETSFTFLQKGNIVSYPERFQNFTSLRNIDESSTVKKYITIHAGSKKNGFIDGAKLIFSSNSRRKDYPEEMDYNIFKNWICKQLIPNLQQASLIVMDDAPHHNGFMMENSIKSLSEKTELIEWLQHHNISFEQNMTDNELMNLYKQHEEYEIDHILKQHGHECLRIPSFHCRFNAIELIWDKCKEYFSKNIMPGIRCDDEKAMKIWNEALEKCTPDIWKNAVIDAESRIADWYKRLPDLTDDDNDEDQKIMMMYSNSDTDSCGTEESDY